MNRDELKRRTKSFALLVIALVESLPKGRTADVIGKQLLRSGSSVGANYRSACRAKSTPDFIFKMSIVEEEADETLYWMELLVDAGLIELGSIQDLLGEANQILAMTVASIKTAKRKIHNSKTEILTQKGFSDDSAIRNQKSEIQ